ncbi:MAG: substrate-binding domain-containing protein [Dactylosporangium sp.]|nr:substrate-binding domain-containing protein [Dactylosporangium sp.]NNJ62623.1 substrate-binding domain-containing protein [Dactylosporangium sp.]
MRIRPRGQIRSHRALHHKLVAPWIIATLVTVLVIVLVSAGFYLLLRKPCSGQLTATIAASPSVASVLESVARDWLEEQPAVNGRCALVDVEAKDSPSMVQALGKRWNTKTNGTPPDAWVPDSSLWIQQAINNPVVARMLPEPHPSLVRSVAVIAMPKPMAEVLGWPDSELTWTTLVTEVAAAGWAQYGKPEWGAVRIGMTDPTKSTTGLLALAAIASPDVNGRPPSQGVATIRKLKQEQSFLVSSTDEIIAEMAKADRQGEEAVFGYVSAFPALETDVLSYNLGNPTTPLVAVYADDGSFDADSPCVVLHAEWNDPARSEVAEKFLRYARSEAGRAAYLDVGFRDADRAAGKSLDEDTGLTATMKLPARATPDTAEVEQLFTAWNG